MLYSLYLSSLLLIIASDGRRSNNQKQGRNLDAATCFENYFTVVQMNLMNSDRLTAAAAHDLKIEIAFASIYESRLVNAAFSVVQLLNPVILYKLRKRLDRY